MAFQFLTGKQNLVIMGIPTASDTRIPMKYSMNTDNRWIYCNYPERITSANMLGDSDKGNVWINQKTVSAGDIQVFYSHYNSYEKEDNIHYGIQIFNPNKTSVTITPLNCGHSSKDWEDVNAGSWARFFNGASDCGTTTAKTIASNGSFWILDKVIPKGCAFSGNLRFRTSGTVIVTVYAFLDRYKITGTGSQYFYNILDSDKEAPKKYSGYGAGYFLTASEITLKASELLNNKRKYFQTCYERYDSEDAVEVNNVFKSEFVPIHIAGTNLVATGKEEDYPLHNIGNWCVQYYIPVKLYNDTNYSITFNGYTQPGELGDLQNTAQNFYILSSGYNNTVYNVVKGSTAKNKNTWHWTSHTIPAHTTENHVYQFILGTNSSKYVNHIWTASK